MSIAFLVSTLMQIGACSITGSCADKPAAEEAKTALCIWVTRGDGLKVSSPTEHETSRSFKVKILQSARAQNFEMLTSDRSVYSLYGLNGVSPLCESGGRYQAFLTINLSADQKSVHSELIIFNQQKTLAVVQRQAPFPGKNFYKTDPVRNATSREIDFYSREIVRKLRQLEKEI
ncbi:MAG: hypothetical protein K5821_06925 [Nitrobacter sp.]|uniref:hypothetical protein n=1 Tax=Nitrobacter sp. TaxID=29420 RepID=UPI0026230EF8|nr:hypothetical protein [Nitrobacter sp.]MCV0386151.1 hypothetical protein [Nitrobacter sp.]